MAGKQGTSTSTGTSEPWSAQKPYIEYGMGQAKNLYESAGPEYYSGSTVAGFSPEQQQSHQLGAARAINGNAGMKLAQNYNNDVIGGKYLNSNPNNDAVFKNIMQQVVPGVNSQFSGSGRTGSDLHADTMTRALTQAYAPYAAQQYNNGIQQMDSAANRAPGFAANDYADIAALGDIGQQKHGMAQNELGDAVNRFNYYRDLPANKLGQYQGFTGGNYGGTTTSATPYYKPSIWTQGAGIALGLGGIMG